MNGMFFWNVSLLPGPLSGGFLAGISCCPPALVRLGKMKPLGFSSAIGTGSAAQPTAETNAEVGTSRIWLLCPATEAGWNARGSLYAAR